MKFKKYLKDKLYLIVSFLGCYLLILLIFLAFKMDILLIIFISSLLLVYFFTIFLYDYLRKNKFYTSLVSNIEGLDKAYLVLETIEKPNFYDGEIFYYALYEINKSMIENVKGFESQINDFKNFVEMWIHEIKIPISSLILMQHNKKDKFDKKSLEQIKKIDEYTEQILYYVRSENANEDYLINEVSLKKVITNIALKNKDDLLENKIELKVLNVNHNVYTDSKWLEFIINQIVNNSIKYRKYDQDSYIKISSKQEENKIILIIEDNGIGIPSSDIKKVFQKSFTGSNGRKRAKSTGMGLFIAKNLCEKLGHSIEIQSEIDKYTRVYITIGKNKFYDVLR